MKTKRFRAAVAFVNYGFVCVVNLSSLGQDDSSSEEAQSIPPTNGKPAVPPRPRSISVDHKRNGGIPGMGGGMLKAKPHNPEELPTKDVDVDSADCKCNIWKGDATRCVPS